MRRIIIWFEQFPTITYYESRNSVQHRQRWLLEMVTHLWCSTLGKYQTAKTQIITAVYPQNLEYDGHQFRTARLNEVIATTFSLDAAFQKQKSGQNGVFSILSAREAPSIQFSNHFMLDLKRLANLGNTA